jgi:hypothetical protein
MVLLLTSSNVMAKELDIYQRTEICNSYANKGVEYMVYANALGDADEAVFVNTVVARDMQRLSTDAAKLMLANLAKTMWANRKKDPADVGAALFDICVKKSQPTA